MRKWLRRALLVIAGLAGFVFINNTNLLVAPHDGKPTLLAHRGIAQRFDTTGLGNDTCTATRIVPPQHAFLENTIASMQAAFAAGADIVEFDIHPTTDGTHIFVLGPYRGGEFSAGIDSQEDLGRLPANYSGGIWTNEIALIAERLHANGR